MTRGIVVGAVTGVRAGRCGVRIPVGTRNVRIDPRAHRASCCYVVTGTLVPGVQRPGLEAGHRYSSGAEVKYRWSYLLLLLLLLLLYYYFQISHCSLQGLLCGMG
jgi:hypothetical protein